MSKFLIRKVPSGFKFDLLAANGQPIACSEVYKTCAACKKGIDGVRRAASKAKLEDQTGEGGGNVTNPKFQLYLDRAGEFRFRLRSRNGEVIAVSDGYKSKASCENGIESVRKNAPKAEIEEE